MSAFSLDADPTRWGAHENHLDPSIRAFLIEQVGEATPRISTPWEDIPVPGSRLDDEQVAELGAIVGVDNCHVDAHARRRCAGGLSYVDLAARRLERQIFPDAVALPETHRQVEDLLSWAEKHGVSIIPFGGGTSVVGGVRPEENRVTISVDMQRMASLIALDDVSQLCTVSAGITGPDLERLLESRGFTLGHFPQSWQRASIGGYAATRSAGQTSTGYGRSDDMIEGLTVVTPRGTLRLGRVAASAAGPDLRQLFIGSEGIFGIITDVTLRLQRRPEQQSYTGVVFATYQQAVNAFRELSQLRIPADVMRLSDPEETAVTLAMSGPTGRAKTVFDKYLSVRNVTEPSLAILGWEGTRSTIAARRMAALPVLKKFGGVSLGATTGQAWLRHRFEGPFLRDVLMDAGYLVETLETATHWSHVTELRQRVQNVLRSSLADGGRGPYVMSHISHVYDTGASLYFTVVARAGDDPIAQWTSAKIAVMDALVKAGATITHHHAVGKDHAPWLAAEIGDTGVEILSDVKDFLDPHHVLNPGVLLSKEVK